MIRLGASLSAALVSCIVPSSLVPDEFLPAIVGMPLDAFYGTCFHPGMTADVALSMAQLTDWEPLPEDFIAQMGAGLDHLEFTGWMAEAPPPDEFKFPFLLGFPKDGDDEVEFSCTIIVMTYPLEFIEAFQNENDAAIVAEDTAFGERTVVLDASILPSVLVSVRFQARQYRPSEPTMVMVAAIHMR